MPVKHDLSPNRWEHFPHSADVGIRGHGATLAESFEQAGVCTENLSIKIDVRSANVTPETAQKR